MLVGVGRPGPRGIGYHEIVREMKLQAGRWMENIPRMAAVRAGDWTWRQAVLESGAAARLPMLIRRLVRPQYNHSGRCKTAPGPEYFYAECPGGPAGSDS